MTLPKAINNLFCPNCGLMCSNKPAITIDKVFNTETKKGLKYST
jgi:hypothetical protein